MSRAGIRTGAIVAALVIAVLPALGQEATEDNATWIRTNLEWVRLIHLEPSPIVNDKRILAQIQLGCAASPIRFGDTAIMREQINAGEWPKDTRHSLSFASLADDFETAHRFVSAELGRSDLTPVQRQVLENQHIHLAIQFQDNAAARRLLDRYENSARPPDSLRSDRLFWRVHAAPDQSGAAWRSEHLSALDAALEADPTSFQVLAWRVLGWIWSEPWKARGLQCRAAIADFSERVLDLSDAGACPLMLGHLSFAMDRAIGEQVARNVSADMAAWRNLAVGILAVILGDRPLYGQILAELNAQDDRVACRATLVSELSRLEGLLHVGPGQ